MPAHAESIKRVMHVTYDMRIGGTEMVIKNIVERMHGEQLQHCIACIESPIGPWGGKLEASGIAIYKLDRNPGFDLSIIKQLRQLIKTHNIDVLHCHQYTPWTYGVLASIGLGINVIFTEHGRFYPDTSSWKRRFINPVLAFCTSQITAISHATKQALVDFEYLPAERIEVIYNGIASLTAEEHEVAKLKQQWQAENKFIFGTIARLDPIKNQTLMLKAFASVCEKHENAILVVVGDGELMPTLQSLATELNISDKVVFTGYQPVPNNYLAAFDVFLLSSLSEGTSMTLLEAMSLGKPCVVTDAGGNAEVIKHNVTGLVSNNDEQEEFAHNMEHLLLNKDVLRQFQQNCLEQFNLRFEADKMCQQYITTYSTR